MYVHGQIMKMNYNIHKYLFHLHGNKYVTKANRINNSAAISEYVVCKIIEPINNRSEMNNNERHLVHPILQVKLTL